MKFGQKMQKVACQWKERYCDRPAWVMLGNRKKSTWICARHRQLIAEREKSAERKAARVGTCIRCGKPTSQKDEDGNWYHRLHSEHELITKAQALEDQAALEKLSADTTTLHEREFAIDRWSRFSHLETYGGESYFAPLEWRKQG